MVETASQVETSRTEMMKFQRHLSVGQLNRGRALVALLDVGHFVLAGAVLGVRPIQGVLVAGQHCVEV